MPNSLRLLGQAWYLRNFFRFHIAKIEHHLQRLFRFFPALAGKCNIAGVRPHRCIRKAVCPQTLSRPRPLRPGTLRPPGACSFSPFSRYFPPVLASLWPPSCSSPLLLDCFEIKQNGMPSGRSRPFPKCVSPHEISTFCTCLKKNRYFPAFFAVLPLRSFSSFVIVRCGPSFLQENRGFPTRGWSRRGRDGQKIQEDRQKKWQLSH
jgi:hypothetical protein